MTPARPYPVEGAFELSGDAAGSLDHFAWKVGENSAPGLWTIEAQGAIGTVIPLTLTNADGEVVGDVLPEADGTARLPDLDLAPGAYTIRLAGPVDGRAPYILRAAYQDRTGADPEPNDDAARALALEPGQLMAGRLARTSDQDSYRLSVDEALGSLLLDARLIVRSGPARRLCLLRLPDSGDANPNPRELSCSDGAEVAKLTGLLLQPADYLLTVSGIPSPDDPYYLRVDTSVAPVAGYETEPNDTPDLATVMSPDTSLSGRLDNTDHVRVHIDGEPQLWQVEARGPEVRLLWERTDGVGLGVGTDPDGSGGRSVLTDVYLIPGDHWFRLDGTGEYTLDLVPLGPPVPGGELESNDELSDRRTAAHGRLGHGPHRNSRGHRRLRLLAGRDRACPVRLEPPPGAMLWLYPEGDTASIASARATPSAGEPIDLDLVLPAGSHAVRVVGPPTQERYRLSLSREDPFDLAVDQEPNDEPGMAGRLPADLRVEGSVETGDEGDWYRLDPLPAAGELTFRAQGIIRSLILDDGISTLPLSADAEGLYRSPPLPAGASLALGVVADGAYSVTLDPGTTGLDSRAGRRERRAARGTVARRDHDGGRCLRDAGPRGAGAPVHDQHGGTSAGPAPRRGDQSP